MFNKSTSVLAVVIDIDFERLSLVCFFLVRFWTVGFL